MAVKQEKKVYDCTWSRMDDLDHRYHDTEWGVPLHDDLRQFEFLSLEVMQCGLNWHLILQKREIFRSCFAGFDFRQLALFNEADVQRILETPGMIRSPRKIQAILSNARLVLQMQQEYGSFSDYLWGFTEGKMLVYRGHATGHIPASNALSDRIAADLRRRGFKYLGSITVYSHLQACGIINDHQRDCPRFRELLQQHPFAWKNREDER